VLRVVAVALALMPGASVLGVIRRLDELTAPSGGLGGHARADQPSHKFGSNEMNELRAAVAGTLGSLRRAVRLPPAEAMRTEPPATYWATLLERAGLGRFLSPPTQMILRQLERQPTRGPFRRCEEWAVVQVVGGRAAARAVRLGQNNGLEAEVLGGLEEGDVVIVYPSDRARDGARVVVRDAARDERRKRGA